MEPLDHDTRCMVNLDSKAQSDTIECLEEDSIQKRLKESDILTHLTEDDMKALVLVFIPSKIGAIGKIGFMVKKDGDTEGIFKELEIRTSALRLVGKNSTKCHEEILFCSFYK